MIIIPSFVLGLLVCCGIELWIKPRWLKVILHSLLIFVISVVVFNVALEAGGEVVRGDNARLVADTLEFFEESIQSNSLPEVRIKLSVVRQELPKAIVSMEPTTPMLLKVWSGEVLTNSVSTPPNKSRGCVKTPARGE
jgi:hypothetical protein